MKMWYLLDPGDAIEVGDEAYVYQKWVPAKYIGKPVIKGAFRRAKLEEAPTAAPNSEKPPCCDGRTFVSDIDGRTYCTTCQKVLA